MAKWIKFLDSGVSKSGKTKVWSVVTADLSETLGEISWYGRWRRYAFFPVAHTVFEKDCLRDIAAFCEDETNYRGKAVSTAIEGRDPKDSRLRADFVEEKDLQVAGEDSL